MLFSYVCCTLSLFPFGYSPVWIVWKNTAFQKQKDQFQRSSRGRLNYFGFTKSRVRLVHKAQGPLPCLCLLLGPDARLAPLAPAAGIQRKNIKSTLGPYVGHWLLVWHSLLHVPWDFSVSPSPLCLQPGQAFSKFLSGLWCPMKLSSMFFNTCTIMTENQSGAWGRWEET